MYTKAELDEVVGQRQAAKERARQLEAQLSELNGKLSAVPDAEQLDAFRKWQADREALDRDAAIKKGDVATLEAKIRAPLEAQVKAKEQHVSTLQNQLTTMLRDNALREAAEPRAHNPGQVVQLLRHRVRMVQRTDGQFAPEFLDTDGQPLYNAEGQRVATATEFVNAFLSLPENANLVKADRLPGSGARPTGGAPQQTGKPRSLAEFEAMTSDQRRATAQAMSSADRMALLGHPSGKASGYIP